MCTYHSGEHSPTLLLPLWGLTWSDFQQKLCWPDVLRGLFQPWWFCDSTNLNHSIFPTSAPPTSLACNWSTQKSAFGAVGRLGPDVAVVFLPWYHFIWVTLRWQSSAQPCTSVKPSRQAPYILKKPLWPRGQEPCILQEPVWPSTRAPWILKKAHISYEESIKKPKKSPSADPRYTPLFHSLFCVQEFSAEHRLQQLLLLPPKEISKVTPHYLQW